MGGRTFQVGAVGRDFFLVAKVTLKHITSKKCDVFCRIFFWKYSYFFSKSFSQYFMVLVKKMADFTRFW